MSLVQSPVFLYSYQPHVHRTATMHVGQESDEPMNDQRSFSVNDPNDSESTDSESEDVAEERSTVHGGESHSAVAAERSMSEINRGLLLFYLFGRILPKHDHLRAESLKKQLSEVKQLYHNIPSILHFTYSTVALDRIGVAASQPLPKDTVLGPYSGKYLTDHHLNKDTHNECLWEVHDLSGVSSYIDGSDPRYGNWMSLIQCARSRNEQNLKLTQQVTDRGVQLYYVAIEDIDYGQELLVWYDTEQVRLYFGLPIALKKKLNVTEQIPTEDGNSGHTSDTKTEAFPSGHSSTSTSTDDSGIYTGDQNAEPESVQTVEIHRDSSPDEAFDTAPQPPVLRPLTKVVADEITFVPAVNPTEPPAHLTTFTTYLQPPSRVTTQYGYMSMGQTSNIPQPSPGQLNTRIWSTKRRSRSRSPTHASIPNKKAKSGDTWRTNGSLKNQLLYGMFTRSEDGSRWQCSRCDRQFNSQGSLRAHARIHTGERPYKCKFCSRTFCQASTLRSHERLHTGEKPYKCGVCGRAFTQSAGLRSHLKTHMGGTRY